MSATSRDKLAVGGGEVASGAMKPHPFGRWPRRAELRRPSRPVPGALRIGLALLSVIVVIAVVVPVAWPESPYTTDIAASLEPPSLSHPMGTDASGRDVLARFGRGARISLVAAAAVVVLGGLVGGAIGLLAGLGRPPSDTVLTAVMDAILAFPPLILAMAVAIGLAPGLTSATIGIAVTSFPYYARLMRGEVRRLRSQPHVDAVRALGASRTRVIGRHLIPHTMATMMVQATTLFGFAILTLAGLGFIGLGAQVPTPEWGAMITDGMQYALTGQWWIAFFPGMGAFISIAGANLVADGLRERWDPHAQIARA